MVWAKRAQLAQLAGMQLSVYADPTKSQVVTSSEGHMQCL